MKTKETIIEEPKKAKAKVKKVGKVDVEAVGEETIMGSEPRKPGGRLLTEKEKKQRRLEAAIRKEEEETAELVAQIRRPLQAKALWAMYQRGELQRQTIHYTGEYGEIKQEMLYSHHSIYAE